MAWKTCVGASVDYQSPKPVNQAKPSGRRFQQEKRDRPCWFHFSKNDTVEAEVRLFEGIIE